VFVRFPVLVGQVTTEVTLNVDHISGIAEDVQKGQAYINTPKYNYRSALSYEDTVKALSMATGSPIKRVVLENDKEDSQKQAGE
jgi:hypothetical protein